MHIALGKGNRHPRFFESVINRNVQIMQHRPPVINAVDIYPQFKVQTVVTKAFEDGIRSRFGENTRIFAGGLHKQFGGQLGIGPVSDSHRYPNTDIFVRKRPVDQPADNKLFVGDDQFLAVPVDDRRCPDADALHSSADVANGDRITDSEGSLEQHDQAADKVCHNFLQPETDADTQSRYQPLQISPFETDRIESNNDADCRYRVSADA